MFVNCNRFVVFVSTVYLPSHMPFYFQPRYLDILTHPVQDDWTLRIPEVLGRTEINVVSEEVISLKCPNDSR